VDGELIHQVLLNICQNAVQAMQNGGQLHIECAPPTLFKHERHFASLAVRDTGTGIAPEHLAHIFDPFFTTKDVGSGTGLGLAVSLRIVEEHGGWISASNCANGGARFIIHLPVVEQTVERALEQVAHTSHL
jgi:signal transduction histidine kinase